MTDKGYDFTTAAEPPALYGEQESITEVELATRAADLQCDRAVALTGAQSEFERERADAWMDEHATLVDELMTRRTEVQRAIVASWEEVQHAAC